MQVASRPEHAPVTASTTRIHSGNVFRKVKFQSHLFVWPFIMKTWFERRRDSTWLWFGRNVILHVAGCFGGQRRAAAIVSASTSNCKYKGKFPSFSMALFWLRWKIDFMVLLTVSHDCCMHSCVSIYFVICTISVILFFKNIDVFGPVTRLKCSVDGSQSI